MAEGGEFGYDGNKLDQKDDDDKQEVNPTQPFQPGAVQTRHHKQTALPDTSYEEIPLLSDFMDKDKKQT